MGGVGLINFLVVPFSPKLYISDKYVDNLQIKQESTAELYNQIKKAFEDYPNMLVFPLLICINRNQINDSNPDNPYFDPDYIQDNNNIYGQIYIPSYIQLYNTNDSIIISCSTSYGASQFDSGSRVDIIYYTTSEVITIKFTP